MVMIFMFLINNKDDENIHVLCMRFAIRPLNIYEIR